MESWKSLTVKGKTGADTLIIDPDAKPAVTSDRTLRLLSSLSVEHCRPGQATEAENAELSRFIESHYPVKSGVIYLTPGDLAALDRLGYRRVLLRKRNGDIVGCVMGLDIAVSYSGQTSPGGMTSLVSCATFLVVHPSLRKAGLGMALLKEGMARSAGLGVPGGYGMTPVPHSTNAVLLNKWYRIIDVETCGERGYPAQAPGHNGYQMPDLKIVEVTTDDEIEHSFGTYRALAGRFPLKFDPSLDDWARLCRAFRCFEIDGAAIAIYTTLAAKIDGTPSRIGWPVMIVGNARAGIATIVDAARADRLMIVILFEIGSASAACLKSLGCTPSDTTHLDFYNIGARVQAGEICIPLL